MNLSKEAVEAGGVATSTGGAATSADDITISAGGSASFATTMGNTMNDIGQERDDKMTTTDGYDSSTHPSVERDIEKNDRHANGEPNQDPEQSTEVFEVSFEGGDSDPDCPRSMNVLRKWMIVCIASSGSFCVTAASSIYTSTYAQMNAEFGSTRLTATLGLSTFVLGISFGPMFFGPLSEFYGRRLIYLIAWTSYLIWIIPSAVAQNLATMVVARFFDGLSGSAFLAVSGGTVNDLFPREQLKGPMLVYSISPFLGPAIGPLVGGFINSYVHWRWTYYVLIIWTSVMWFLIVFLVPETYHPIVLRNKAKRLRKETGDERWKAPVEMTNVSVVTAIGLSLLRPFQLLFFETMVISLCIFSAILLGILYLFFGAFPLVFGTLHDFNLWQIGLSFMGMFVGMILAALGDYAYHQLRVRRAARKADDVKRKPEPEDQLPTAIVGSFLVTGGLFMFGWTSFAHVHWIAPIIGSAVFGAGTLLVYTGIFTFLVDAYAKYAASALAANAFIRCIFAAAFPLFGVQMYNTLGFPWATSLLGFLTLVMIPFPWIFWKYGHRIRRRSRFCASS